jgi:predicted Rdx family selenoprotein
VQKPNVGHAAVRGGTHLVAAALMAQEARSLFVQAYEVVAYYPVNGGRAAFAAQILIRRLKVTGGLPVPRWKVTRTASR